MVGIQFSVKHVWYCDRWRFLATFTSKQGQYLAFIHHYTKVNRRPPAQTDIQRYFGTSPPTVHSMIVRLHELNLIEREPRTARSIRVRVPVSEIPDLQ